jgi:hypothetical protein
MSEGDDGGSHQRNKLHSNHLPSLHCLEKGTWWKGGGRGHMTREGGTRKKQPYLIKGFEGKQTENSRNGTSSSAPFFPEA